MINVTTTARDVLQEALQRAGVADEDVAIRLAPTPSAANAEGDQVQLGLVLDRPQDGDQVVEHNGRTVLVVDQMIADQLDGATLDAVDTPDGRRLTLNR